MRLRWFTLGRSQISGRLGPAPVLTWADMHGVPLLKVLTNGTIGHASAARLHPGGVPEAADLRVLRSGGVTRVFAGKTALFWFRRRCRMRNIAVAAAADRVPRTQVGGAGADDETTWRPAQRARREGPPGWSGRGGPHVDGPGLGAGRAWRAPGCGRGDHRGSGSAVHGAAGSPARCKASWSRRALPLAARPRRAGRASAGAERRPCGARRAGAEQPEPAAAEPGVVAVPGRRGRRRAECSPVCGAMLPARLPGRPGRSAERPTRRTDAPCCRGEHGFRAGAATAEQVKHWPAEAGRCGLPCASLRTLRRGWPRSPTPPPLELQAAFAQAMLAANPETSGCTTSMTTRPYAGETGRQGLEQQAGPAERARGHARDTHEAAVCFVTASRPGYPSRCEGAGRAEETSAGHRIMLGLTARAPTGVFAPAGEQGHW